MRREIEEIRGHYNCIAEKDKSIRNESEAINIRNTNNFIKACLIRSYVKRDDTVLDMGCGKGGDLLKYAKAEISEYYGVDIADASVKDAEARFRKMNCRFKAEFRSFDVYSKKVNFCRRFDVVSSQFSFHYAFSSEESLETALCNVVRHLKLGGYFIMTVPSRDAIFEKYKAGKLRNKFYEIEFLEDCEAKIPFEERRCYRFTLLDSVKRCIEYFVDFDAMENKLKKLGVKLVERRGFVDFYEQNKKKNNGLFRRMHLGRLSQEEIEVIEIYEVIVFLRSENAL